MYIYIYIRVIFIPPMFDFYIYIYIVYITLFSNICSIHVHTYILEPFNTALRLVDYEMGNFVTWVCGDYYTHHNRETSQTWTWN